MLLDIFLEMPSHQLLLVKEELYSQHFLITIAHRKHIFSGSTYVAPLKICGGKAVTEVQRLRESSSIRMRFCCAMFSQRTEHVGIN